MSPRTTHAYRPLSLKRRTWLTLGAVVLGGAGAVTVAVAGQSDGDGEAAVKPRPAKVHSLALKGTGGTGRELPSTDTEAFSMLGVTWNGGRNRLKGTAQVRTRSSETGAWSGWQDLDLDTHLPDNPEPGMRGLSDPLWVGPSDAVQARITAAGGGSAALPEDLRLDLVDPGVTNREAAAASGKGAFAGGKGSLTAAPMGFSAELSPSPAVTDTTAPSPVDTAPTAPAPADTTTAISPAATDPAPAVTDPAATATATAAVSDTAAPTTTASPSPTVPTAPPSTVTRPPILDRTTWGADESLVQDPPEYIEKVSAVFVHHTVGSNDYSCLDSPALVRGIFEYHVNSNGWNDLGYNFLVDKCGTVFEGRAGGVDLPVRGAHTYGFNGDSAGVAMLGDFHGGGKPTKAALEAVARVAAWKLGQYGGSPSGKVTLTAAADTGVWKTGDQPTLNTVSGHRDGFSTACPGDALYAKLADIRRFASGPGANSAAPTSDVNHDGVPDLVAGTPFVSGGVGSFTVVPGGADGPMASAKRTITQSSPGIPGGSEAGDNFGADTAWGDVNGDGYADLAVGAPREDLDIHTNAGGVTVVYGPGLDSGKFYATSTSSRASGDMLGTSVTVGDFNSDGNADVFSVAPGKPGRWWAFDGRTGGSKAGWLNTTAYNGTVSGVDSATGDFNRDGYADVVVNFRDTSGYGRVLVLKGSATGLQRVGILGVKGGRSVAVGDVNGDGYADAVVGQPYVSESGAYRGGQVTAFYGSASGLTTTGRKTIHQDTAGVPGAAENGDAMGLSVAVGDVNLDGYADVLAGAPREDITRSGVGQTDAGMVILLRGSSTGLTTTGAQLFHQDTSGITGWTEKNDRFGSSVVLNDLSGWSRADVAIGAEGENAYDGTILQLDSGSSGIITGSAAYYGRSELGTPAGAKLGLTLIP